MDAWVLRSTADLVAEGWSTHRLTAAVRRGDLARVRHGIYVDPSLAGDHLVQAAAVLARHSDAVVLSHASAALVHGLAVDRAPTVVHLSTHRPAGGGVRRAGYHLHGTDLAPDDVTTVGGLRVTSLARTVADLARTSPFEWAVAATDQFLARQGDRASLVALAEAHPRWHGRRRLLEAAAFADGGSRSVAESVSRVSIARAKLPRPVLQFEVIGPTGWVATSDFGWPEVGVVGEMDGRGKYGTLLRPGRTAERAIMDEKRRDEEIRLAGYHPVHWDWRTAWDPGRLDALLRPLLLP